MIDMSKYTLIRRTLSGLSLAVHLQDNSARLPAPAGRIEVILKKFNRKAIKNLSGYHVYLALEDGDYEVQIDSDYYLPKTFTVTLPDSGTSSDDEITFTDLGEAALAEVTLIPDVSYPFPSGATLVRGQVLARRRVRPPPGVAEGVAPRRTRPPHPRGPRRSRRPHRRPRRLPGFLRRFPSCSLPAPRRVQNCPGA